MTWVLEYLMWTYTVEDMILEEKQVPDLYHHQGSFKIEKGWGLFQKWMVMNH